jgi:hypothetical protein
LDPVVQASSLSVVEGRAWVVALAAASAVSLKEYWAGQACLDPSASRKNPAHAMTVHGTKESDATTSDATVKESQSSNAMDRHGKHIAETKVRESDAKAIDVLPECPKRDLAKNNELPVAERLNPRAANAMIAVLPRAVVPTRAQKNKRTQMGCVHRMYNAH